MNPKIPIAEAELQAFVDSVLPIERQKIVVDYLACYPEEAMRVQSYRKQKQELRALFDPVLSEALPPRVLQIKTAPKKTHWPQISLGMGLALLSAAMGWGARDMVLAGKGAREVSQNLANAAGNSLAHRAVVAHAVFSPDARRPVEVDAAHEDQLVMWLTKRMGTPMKAPHLQTLGYTLEGGRLLPGDQGPVSQFMYRDEAGGKLTLYVSKEIGDLNGKASKPAEATNTDTAFRFSQQGKVNVFYWVDGPLGYAISSEADRPTLAKVSSEVYQQLTVAK